MRALKRTTVRNVTILIGVAGTLTGLYLGRFLNLNAPEAKATTIGVMPEGLPVMGKLISKTPITLSDGRQALKVIYRSAGIFPTESTSSTLLKDNFPQLPPFLTGTYGDLNNFDSIRVWMNCPAGYSLTMFPGLLPNDQQYAVPQWTDQVSVYAVSHPDVAVYYQQEHVYRMRADGTLDPVNMIETLVPPSCPECDPATYYKRAFVYEYEGIFTGDVSGFIFPNFVTHYMYRVAVAQ